MTHPSPPERPPRTLGINIAFVMSAVFFSIMPLMLVVWDAALRARVLRSGVALGSSVQTFAPAVGFAGISNAQLLLRAVPALLFLFVTLVAWRGRPHYMRVVHMGSVVLLWFYYTAVALVERARANALIFDGLTSPNPFEPLRNVGFLFSGLMVAYVVWYMNRAPARAFFRGYYLKQR